MASGRCLILVATLVLALLCISAVLQSGTASAQDANPTRDLPDAPVQRGETFDVTITFIAPDDNFNSIGLVDEVPADWDIHFDQTWCTPNADQAKIEGNQLQYMWYGPYSSRQAFTALYKVTVPIDAEFVTYSFDGQLGYNIASSTRIFEDTGGDFSTDVTVAAPSTTPTPTFTPSPTLTPTPTLSLTPTPTPAPSPTPTPIPATEGGLGPGAWIGIAIVSLLGTLLLVGLAAWMVKRRRIKEA